MLNKKRRFKNCLKPISIQSSESPNESPMNSFVPSTYNDVHRGTSIDVHRRTSVDVHRSVFNQMANIDLEDIT